jgi:hypothetical protein
MRLIIVFATLTLMGPSVVTLHADTPGGKVIKGPGFEGVICTPAMLRKDNPKFTWYGAQDMWTPLSNTIEEAERALPGAVAKLTEPKRNRVNYPKFYTAKSGSNLNFNNRPDLIPSRESDSDFLYQVAPFLSQFKRQYLGLTIKGKKVLLMSFFPDPASFSDPTYLGDWKHDWVMVLGGDWNFWTVIYDPSTGYFSDWRCNADED